MSEHNTVVIARGLPGSGKSYTVGELIENFDGEAIVCSADHYFTDAEGIYRFDPAKLGDAHGACRDKFVKALEANIPLVVVDNTNTQYKELRDYVAWASIAGYRVKLVESNAPWARNINECFKRNRHGVPIEVVRAMSNRYQSNEEISRWCSENLNVIVEY